MFSRTFKSESALFLTACALAAGCSRNDIERRGTKIECALDGSMEYRPSCTFEIDGIAAILHRPDGGFYRLVRDEAEWRMLDGANDIRRDSRDDIVIGGDRYRLPPAVAL